MCPDVHIVLSVPLQAFTYLPLSLCPQMLSLFIWVIFHTRASLSAWLTSSFSLSPPLQSNALPSHVKISVSRQTLFEDSFQQVRDKTHISYSRAKLHHTEGVS